MTADRNFRKSPLSDLRDRLATLSGAITVTEVPFLAQINVRAAALPAPAPRDSEVLALGPDEFLVVGPPGSEDRLTEACHGPEVSLVDVSAQRTALDLSGPGVRELLAFGCSIDLHPRVFAVGDCAQTVLAHTPVVLQRRETGFRVLVRSSFAAHLAAWILDVSPELTAGH
ncbi:sarcosine oxidase subunit gamma family protein [Actinoplanes sp. NPDC026670]|uniref:sarcosine oxidase subunit gamma n=1 Tax=Actinoplanes sp. NPDC026670 TaxID=3154700 RepID=UPI0033DFA80F